MSDDPLHTRLAALVGEPSRMHRRAADPVSAAQVRRWVEAFGEESPIYTDAAAARAAGWADLVVPRAMLAAFSGRGLRETIGADDISMLTHALGGLGLLPAGVGISQTYLGDIGHGDVLTETTEVAAVSPRKVTKLGPGYFLTVQTRFANQAGIFVGVQEIVLLAYPARRLELETTPARQGAPGDPTSNGGEALPPMAVTLDRLGVIACTAACGDFAAGHYDPDIARARGFEDIFTDVYSGIGFVHRYVAGWAGPAARVEKIDLRLGASFYAGDTLHLTGRLLPDDGPQRIVQIEGRCRTGTHVSGTVALAR